jgi:hypothetical protein
MKRSVLVLGLCLSFLVPLAFAQERDPGGSPGDAALYARLVEGLIERDFAKAEAAGKELEALAPDSPFVAKAHDMMERYGRKPDTSGVVPFYIGSLSTGVALATILPSNIVGYGIDNLAINGSAYLAGAGAGLGAAWLMSRDRDFSLAKDIWIESIEVATVATWMGLYETWAPAPVYQFASPTLISARDRIEMLGLSGLLVGSRGLTYAILQDAKPSFGKAAFSAQLAAWSVYYTLVTQYGLLGITEGKIANTVTLGTMDACLAFGGLAWDQLHWSAYRSGLISVGGLAGILFGTGINMIVSGFVKSNGDKIAASIMLGSALVGQVVATNITEGMEIEEPSIGMLHLGLSPAITSHGQGLRLQGTIFL